MITHLHSAPKDPQRVVVLGASGFLGKSLCRQLLDRQVEVIALSSKDLDLCQPDSSAKLARILRRSDALVFISAITPDRGRDMRTLLRNLTMVQHVAEALEKAPCDHLVYYSSDAVYDDNAPLLSSDSPCNPASFHGVMHLAREIALRATTQKIGCPLLLLRPCAVYGPGDTHNSYGPNRFVRSAQKDGTIALFGNGEEMRDHVYVDDLSRVAVEGLIRRSAGTINVASGKSISFHDVAQIVAKQCNQPVTIQGAPRSSPVTHRHFDPAEGLRAFPDLQYTPLEQGLKSMTEPT